MPTHLRPRVIKSSHAARHERRKYERNRAALRREAADSGAPCSVCGRAIDYTLGGMHPLGFTADHVRPRSRGGSNERENLAPVHRACNRAKSDGTQKVNTPRVQGRDRSAEW